MAIFQDLWQILTRRALPSTPTAASIADVLRAIEARALSSTPTANSAADILRAFELRALSGAPVADSLDDLVRAVEKRALVSSPAVNSAAAVLRKLQNVALDGTELADSAFRILRQVFLEASAAAPVTNSALDRVKGGPSFTTVVPVVRPANAAPAALTTSAGGAWTKGAWVELVAANNITTDFAVFAVVTSPASGGALDFELDIGTGAGGAEVVIGSVVGTHTPTTTDISVNSPLLVGLKVLANTRVACRCSGSVAGAGLDVKLSIYPLPL